MGDYDPELNNLLEAGYCLQEAEEILKEEAEQILLERAQERARSELLAAISED